jgi:cation transport protein ChaC
MVKCKTKGNKPAAAFGGRPSSDSKVAAADVLGSRPESRDIWVFCYGSLMWDPALRHLECRRATVRRWHRRFCLLMPADGCLAVRLDPVLTLDRGGRAHGVVFRLPKDRELPSLVQIWPHKEYSEAYSARWVEVDTAGGTLRAIVLIVNADGYRYKGALSEAEAAKTIAVAKGDLAEDLSQTVAYLKSQGITDVGLRRIHQLVQSHLATTRDLSHNVHDAA